LGRIGLGGVVDGIQVSLQGFGETAGEVVDLANAEPSGSAGIEIGILGRGDPLLEVFESAVEIAVPELDGSFLEKDSFPRHAVIAGGVRGFEAGDGLGGGEAANAVAGHAVHLGYLQAEQEVAREAGNQVLDQGDGAAGLILAAVEGAQEDFGLEAVELAVLRDILNDADALLLVAMDSDDEAEHAVVPGEAANDVIVKTLDQARIDVVRLDLTE